MRSRPLRPPRFPARSPPAKRAVAPRCSGAAARMVALARAPAPAACGRASRRHDRAGSGRRRRAFRRASPARSRCSRASIWVSPMARRPKTRLSTSRSSASRPCRWRGSLERGAVEHKRLLRQPEEARLARERQPGLETGGRAVAAVDLFRRDCGRLDRGALVEPQLDAVGVAARDAAAGVDDDRLARAPRAGKASAQASGLEYALGLGAGPGP